MPAPPPCAPRRPRGLRLLVLAGPAVALCSFSSLLAWVLPLARRPSAPLAVRGSARVLSRVGMRAEAVSVGNAVIVTDDEQVLEHQCRASGLDWPTTPDGRPTRRKL